MSGGVDSAVALLRAGPDAIGVTLRLWLDPTGPDAERACCSPEAVIAARETCHGLGLPHVTLDLREEFRRAVVDAVRARLRARARRRTRASAATAASASPSCSRSPSAPAPSGSRPGTTRGSSSTEGGCCSHAPRDERKDQSYMLARLDPRCLGRHLVPARRAGQGGDARRGGARRARGRPRRAESQEACFLAGDDYRAFLERHGLEADGGRLVDEDGRELGRHDGFWRFTPGQRKGLGVAAGEPLYALRSEAATNTVVVGPRAALATREIHVRGRLHLPVGRAEAKLRYRSPAVGARSQTTEAGFRLQLDEPAYGVAPGQAAVLYDGDAVVGAGTIVPASWRNRPCGFRVCVGGRMTGDEITLTIPREEPFHEVAHLVLGGVAARLNLTFESIDDLETALDAVLERAAEDGEVTVRLAAGRRRDRDRASARSPATALRAELERELGDGVDAAPHPRHGRRPLRARRGAAGSS